MAERPRGVHTVRGACPATYWHASSSHLFAGIMPLTNKHVQHIFFKVEFSETAGRPFCPLGSAAAPPLPAFPLGCPTHPIPSIHPTNPLRSLELEAAPDADTPRPVGVGLLLCMLERGGEGPGRALIELAATLQVRQNVAAWMGTDCLPSQLLAW